MRAKKRIVSTKKSNSLRLSFRNKLIICAVVIILGCLSVGAVAFGRGPLASFFAKTTGVYQITTNIDDGSILEQVPNINAISSGSSCMTDCLKGGNPASFCGSKCTPVTPPAPKPPSCMDKCTAQGKPDSVCKNECGGSTTGAPVAQPKAADKDNSSPQKSPVQPKTGVTCTDNAGRKVNVGATVIGGVITTSSGTKEDSVYECTANGSWKQKMCGSSPCTNQKNPEVVTIKPTYQILADAAAAEKAAKTTAEKAAIKPEFNCNKGGTIYATGDVTGNNEVCDAGKTVPVNQYVQEQQATCPNDYVGPDLKCHPRVECSYKSRCTADGHVQTCVVANNVTQESVTSETCKPIGGTAQPAPAAVKDAAAKVDCERNSGKQYVNGTCVNRLADAPGAFGTSTAPTTFKDPGTLTSNSKDCEFPFERTDGKFICLVDASALQPGVKPNTPVPPAQVTPAAPTTNFKDPGTITKNKMDCEFPFDRGDGTFSCLVDASAMQPGMTPNTPTTPTTPATPEVKKKAGESCSITGSALFGGIPNLSACEHSCGFNYGWYCTNADGSIPSNAPVSVAPTTNFKDPGTLTSNSKDCEFPFERADGKFICLVDGSAMQPGMTPNTPQSNATVPAVDNTTTTTTTEAVGTTRCSADGTKVETVGRLKTWETKLDCGSDQGSCQKVGSSYQCVQHKPDGAACSTLFLFQGDPSQCASKKCSFFNPTNPGPTYSGKLAGWYCSQ